MILSVIELKHCAKVEVCMGMGKTGIPWIPMGMGVRSAMGWESELSAWELELRRGSCHQQL